MEVPLTLLANESGSCRDSYHPEMLTKIIIYAYTQRLYSSRQIAKALMREYPFHVSWSAAPGSRYH
ncbi:transposase [Paenibacillus wynnii]|uniref:transposase n=1 Tax=Paenibacillus wynnii TaxID=268407 RepID=UPI000A021A5E